MSHFLCNGTGEAGGYQEKITLDDMGQWGVCSTPKKGDIIKVQPLSVYAILRDINKIKFYVST